MAAAMDAIKRRLHEAIEHSINAAGNEIYIDAVRRAPVRKVFKGANHHGGRNQIRAVTKADVNFAGASSVGKQLASKGSAFTTTRRSKIHAENPFSRAFHPDFLKARAEAIRGRLGEVPNAREVFVSSTGTFDLANVQGEKAKDKALSTRGRYELNSGRAVFSTTGSFDRQSSREGRISLGGRLRKEITITPLKRSGSHMSVSVVSPTPYAKYVEFGTRYAAAQPYMRPALAKVHAKFAAILRDQIKKAAKDIKQRQPITPVFGPRAKKVNPTKTFSPKTKVSAADIDRLESVVRVRGGGMV